MSKHTPTPWTAELVKGGGRDVYWGIGRNGSRHATIQVWRRHRQSREEAQANAEFIVRACNAHDELVAVLKDTEAWLTKRLEWIDKNGRSSIFETTLQAHLDAIRDALVKAEGGK